MRCIRATKQSILKQLFSLIKHEFHSSFLLKHIIRYNQWAREIFKNQYLLTLNHITINTTRYIDYQGRQNITIPLTIRIVASHTKKPYSSSALVRNLVAVEYPTAVFVSDLSYVALFATKQNPHYVEMVLIVTVSE